MTVEEAGRTSSQTPSGGAHGHWPSGAPAGSGRGLSPCNNPLCACHDEPGRVCSHCKREPRPGIYNDPNLPYCSKCGMPVPRKADAHNNLTLCGACGQRVRAHDDAACPVTAPARDLS